MPPALVCLVLSSRFFSPPHRIIRTKVQQPPNQQVPASSHSIGKENFFFLNIKKKKSIMDYKYSKELLIILMDR